MWTINFKISLICIATSFHRLNSEVARKAYIKRNDRVNVRFSY